MTTEFFADLIELSKTDLPTALAFGVLLIFGVAFWQWVKNRPAQAETERDLNAEATKTILELLDQMKDDLKSAQCELARTRKAIRYLHDICEAQTDGARMLAIKRADYFLKSLQNSN